MRFTENWVGDAAGESQDKDCSGWCACEEIPALQVMTEIQMKTSRAPLREKKSSAMEA